MLLMETGGCFEMPETYEGMCRLIDRGVDFTAVFTLSDTTGIAAMKALQDRGRRVPEDVSVIAIDGLRVSEYITPTLTTMVQPGEERPHCARAHPRDRSDFPAARHEDTTPDMREIFNKEIVNK